MIASFWDRPRLGAPRGFGEEDTPAGWGRALSSPVASSGKSPSSLGASRDTRRAGSSSARHQAATVHADRCRRSRGLGSRLAPHQPFGGPRRAIAAVAIAVTFAFWFLHARTLPFAYRFQNALESWLYFATTLLLALAAVYAELPQEPASLRIGIEVLMAAVLLGSLVAGIVFSIRDLRRTRRALVDVDFSAALCAADSRIDSLLADRLRDGSARLLRCSWLSSPAASGAVIMRRRQDLPPVRTSSCRATRRLPCSCVATARSSPSPTAG